MFSVQQHGKHADNAMWAAKLRGEHMPIAFAWAQYWECHLVATNMAYAAMLVYIQSTYGYLVASPCEAAWRHVAGKPSSSCTEDAARVHRFCQRWLFLVPCALLGPRYA